MGPPPAVDDAVRTLTAVEQTGYDGQLIQVIPAGVTGIIRHTRPDGAHTAELVTAPRAEEHGDDDDFDDGLADVTLTDGQYEVIPSLCQNWTLHPERPFATPIAIAGSYLAPEANGDEHVAAGASTGTGTATGRS